MLKRLITYGFIALSLGVASNVCFSIYLNRDFRYFSNLIDVTSSWEKSLRETHPHTYVISGGSSTRAGVNPQLILNEYNIPIVLASLGAGYGMEGNLELALTHLKPQDTLIVAMELELMVKTLESTLPPMGAKMLLKQKGLAIYQSPILNFHRGNFLSPFGGGSLGLASHFAKNLTSEEGERYAYDKHSIIHPSGWMEITRKEHNLLPIFLQYGGKSLGNFNLHDDVKVGLQRVIKYCNTHQIRIIAMMPRVYGKKSAQSFTLWISLQLTRMGIPVLYDKQMGIETDANLIADTTHHLNAMGTQNNSREIGANLRDQRFWTEQELINELEKRGWDSNAQQIPGYQPPAE